MNDESRHSLLKKRVSLPVLSSKSTLLDQTELGVEQSESRSSLAWVGLGVMANFVVLIPLALFGTLPFREFTQGVRPMSGRVLVLIAFMGACVIVIASFSSGYLIGRMSRVTKVRDGVWAGLIAGLILWVVSISSNRDIATILAGASLLLISTLCTSLGTYRGKRAR